MKRILSAAVFNLSLLLIVFVFLTLSAKSQSSARGNVASSVWQELLDLPAPAARDDAEEKKDRPADFLSYKNIPADDAPLEDLLDYWASQGGSPYLIGFRPEMSERTVERILDHCAENPEDVTKFLSSLPATPDVAEKVKRIYDALAEKGDAPAYENQQVKEWLRHNSTFYLDELIRAAQKVKDTNEYITNEDEHALRSLARVDWNSASPIVSRLESDASQPYSQLLAKWILYSRAIDEKNTGDAEKYRRELQDIVENKKEFWRKRDLAMDALVAGGDWDGRDEWYLSLLEDETLLEIQDNNFTGLTTMIAAAPPDKWIEKMIRLTKSENLAARSAAVRNLSNVFTNQKEIAEAFLPWLANPNWARQSSYKERGKFIAALAEIELPESVPGLLTVLSNEEEMQTTAARAIARYKDPRAVLPLRIALSKTEDAEARNIFIAALVACGGFSDDEQMANLEAYAALISTPEGAERVQNQYVYTAEGEAQYKPLPLQISIGKFVAGQTEPSEGLVARAIERVKILRRVKPPVAKTLAEIMQKWRGRAIYLEMLRQLKTGEATTDLIVSLLTKRADLREKVPVEIASLHGLRGAARGTGACLAEDAANFQSILNQTDREAQLAMFGCARLLRVKLPVAEVGEFLKSPDKTLAQAAESYLKTEDSPAARNLILAVHPNEALILGARQAFFGDKKVAYDQSALSELFESVNGVGFWGEDSEIFKKSEQKLQKEIKDDAGLIAMFGILPENNTGQELIRVYKDRVIYTFYEDAARYRERRLTAKEYEDFYRFLVENKIDELSSITSSCDECSSVQFLMFGKAGGRRVYIESAYDAPKTVKKLFEYFENFQKGEMKLKYFLADKIKGLEVLLADDDFPVHAVWKKDDDLRFLVEDKAKGAEIEKSISEEFRAAAESVSDSDYEAQQRNYQMMEKRRKETAYAHFGWRNLENGKPGAFVAQPADAQFLYDETQVGASPEIDPSPRAWQVRAADGEIRAGALYAGGLYRIAPGQSPVKIKDGRYANPIVTPDGKWVVAAKRPEDYFEPGGIVRINRQTTREFPLAAVPPADTFMPLTFIKAHNKVLLFRARGVYARDFVNQIVEIPEQADEMRTYATANRNQKPNPSPKTPEYYLFDPATGAVQPVKGEFRPLFQLSYRALQPTANADEFWAAIYDPKTKTTDIGRYDEKTFAFQSVKQIPDIELNSMDVWVDEKASKIYFVYQGHLLTLPLAN